MIAYTDGATSNNGKIDADGGWAFVIVDEFAGKIITENSGYIKNATNNICELTALINACKYLSKNNFFESHIIYSDSAYCINCYKDKWYKKWERNGWLTSNKTPVANQELWRQLIPFFESPILNFKKIQGHSGNYWNEYVDNLAVIAKRRKSNG